MIKINQNKWICIPNLESKRNGFYLKHKSSGLVFYGYSITNTIFSNVRLVTKVKTNQFKLFGKTEDAVMVKYSVPFNGCIGIYAKQEPVGRYWKVIQPKHSIRHRIIRRYQTTEHPTETEPQNHKIRASIRPALQHLDSPRFFIGI